VNCLILLSSTSRSPALLELGESVSDEPEC
jgi:hypothetical protein